MRIEDNPKIELPKDMDDECVDICNLLNRLPCTVTKDSCQGHGKRPFLVFFKCGDIDVLTRLGRSVDRRYSDGNWEIVLDDTDVDPRGRFLLRSVGILDKDTMKESTDGLISNILYWFDDRFDGHFGY